MALIACPGCSLPRTASDSASACPVCGHLPTVDSTPTVAAAAPLVPLTPAPPATRPDPPREPSLLPWILAGLGFGGTLVCAAGWYLASTDLPRLPDSATPAPEVAARELAPTPRRVPDGPEVAPPPRGIVVVSEKPNPWRVNREGEFAVLRIDQPDDIYKLPLVGAKTRLKLVGVANKLTVEGVTDGAILDATELVVSSVSVTRPIDGGATVRLKCPGGTVTVARGVSGGATLVVDAAGGGVSFPLWKGKRHAIEGGARVTLTARTVTFLAPVSAPDTRVDVTLTARGNLRFVEMSDGAKMVYRAAKPDDPPLIVNPGRILDTAECKRDD